MVKEKIVVLHCFTKDTEKTEQKDINTANKRLKDALEEQRTLKRYSKQKRGES
jgi:phage-related protein